jgi:hypothetical protein
LIPLGFGFGSGIMEVQTGPVEKTSRMILDIRTTIYRRQMLKMRVTSNMTCVITRVVRISVVVMVAKLVLKCATDSYRKDYSALLVLRHGIQMLMLQPYISQ